MVEPLTPSLRCRHNRSFERTVLKMGGELTQKTELFPSEAAHDTIWLKLQLSLLLHPRTF